MPLYNGDQSKSYLSQLVTLAKNGFNAFSYQQLTVAGTVVNPTIPAETKYAMITLESDVTSGIAIRFLETGQTVVASGTGMPLENGGTIDVVGAQNLSQFQAIQEGAGTHKLNITYYK